MPSKRRDRMDPGDNRVGRAVDAFGAIVLAGLAIVALSFAAWFITAFSDSCTDRFLACAIELWPVWLVVGVLALGVSLTLARVWMGGSTALAAGDLAGSVIAIIGIWQLTVGSHDGVRTLLLLAATTGGLTMALRSWWRLRVRRSARGSTLPHA